MLGQFVAGTCKITDGDGIGLISDDVQDLFGFGIIGFMSTSSSDNSMTSVFTIF